MIYILIDCDGADGDVYKSKTLEGMIGFAGTVLGIETDWMEPVEPDCWVSSDNARWELSLRDGRSAPEGEYIWTSDKKPKKEKKAAAAPAPKPTPQLSMFPRQLNLF